LHNKIICARKPLKNRMEMDNRWRSPIHMPRWASRILLEVTDVRVERVQEIGEADAECEGVGWDCCGEGENDPRTPREAFCGLWDSINAKRGYSWKSNPWIWAITFKRIGGD